MRNPFRLLGKAARMPPDVLAHKVREVVERRARRWRAKLFPPRLTDEAFFAAVSLSPRAGASSAAGATGASGAIGASGEGELLSHFRARATPSFFIHPGRREELISAWKRAYPQAAKETLTAAERFCDHVFDLLGSGPVSLGPEIDWHADFKVGKRWPLRHYTDIDYMCLDEPCDVKVPWELSRFQHLPALGKAYWLTGDEKYAREFAAQLSDWLEKNPPYFGVNWACAMDVAIRAVNWIWAYHFFAGSPSVSARLELDLLKSLLVHGRYIIANLEYGEVNGNHYLSDGVGLVYLGLMFPEFREARGWLDKGLEIVFGEIENQVYPDGVDHEGSVPYHRLVTELFLSPALLCLRNGTEAPAGFLARLERMLEFVLHYTKPDGSAPLVGDADDGRLHILSEETRERINDHRYLLALGAVLFRRADFAAGAGKFWEEAFWLMGPEGEREFSALLAASGSGDPGGRRTHSRRASAGGSAAAGVSLAGSVAAGSRAFPEGGFYVMRSRDRYLFLDCGDIGLRGRGGHGHNDLLSVEVYAGEPLVTDSGAYAYTADPAARNLFRGTAAHNTVMVDGEEMARLGEGLWTIRNDALPRVHRWETGADYDLFDGEHSGYERLPDPVTHRRQVFFDKAKGFWVIKDLLSGRGEHLFELFFHFPPGSQVEVDGLIVRTAKGSGVLALAPLETEGLSVDALSGWFSASYGRREPAPYVRYARKAGAPVSFVTLVFPGPAPPRAAEAAWLASRALALMV